MTAAELIRQGWAADAIYRAVDRGLLQARKERSGGVTWWDFQPADHLTWHQARQRAGGTPCPTNA